MIQTQQQLVRRRKSKINAEQSAFTCFLVYFVVKILFIVTLYKYDNYLKHQPYVWIIFISLALVNTYLILYTGKNPGYQEANIQENELLNFDKNDKTFCSICNCRRKNRSKHCFYCGKCVRKFDHHCPWIGACVGQNNQRIFWLFLLTQTLQSYNAFVICYQSKNLFEYHEAGHFSQQYGVFTVFSIWMLFYIALAGGLLIFHSFLIISNYTTKELFQRNKCSYLQGIKGNPFSQGLFRNILMTIQVQQYGRQWVIDAKTDEQRQRERTFIQKIWSNDYYSCC